MFKKILALSLIGIAVYWSYKVLLPGQISNIDTPDSEFSTERALLHLKEISKEPHYLGNEAHTVVRNYIISQLEQLGLETQVQEGYSMSQWGNLSKPKNILARLKGSNSGKALLLLTHYDSNPHSSLGASDAGSGVVTILEGIRAFLITNKLPKNDIIILISDGEELGLNGADIFVNQHPWANDVGLVLNFEARGSGGPSYMLIETNQGNSQLMKHFVNANPEYPVANSLAYSIYKMLPNDTDLTRFREDGDIDGFNFAFIDDHFDYHTVIDSYGRLDRNSLEHQGSYLMPLLHYFSQADLTTIKSYEDDIYFNVPLFKTVTYSFTWIFPMLLLTIILFGFLLFYGFKKGRLTCSAIGKGYVVFLGTLLTTAILGFLLWKLLLIIYPQYQEMLHGFTYNGHTYISAFVCLTLAICFYLYSKIPNEEQVASLFVAPLSIWLLICIVVAFKLKGASFFIIPLLFGLIQLVILIRQKRPDLLLMALLGFPVITIMGPLVKMFTVGLGLKILFVSCIVIVLIFGLLLPVFSFFKNKNTFSFIFLIGALWFFVSAHRDSDFTTNTPKPNSLLYVLDSNSNEAVWATYDNLLDQWTKSKLGDKPSTAFDLQNNTIGSKYRSGFTYTKKAPAFNIPKAEIEISRDTIIDGLRHIAVCYKSNRNAERIEVFSDSTSVFNQATINGVSAIQDGSTGTVFNERYNNRLFSYYVADNEPLDMIFKVPLNQTTHLQFYEATYNLLDHPLLDVKNRDDNMIPKPFVLNDAIVVKTTLKIK